VISPVSGSIFSALFFNFALVPRAAPPRSGDAGASPAHEGAELSRFRGEFEGCSAKDMRNSAGVATGVQFRHELFQVVIEGRLEARKFSKDLWASLFVLLVSARIHYVTFGGDTAFLLFSQHVKQNAGK